MVDSSSPTGDCASSDEESFECIDDIVSTAVQASKKKESLDVSVQQADSAFLIDQKDATILDLAEQLKIMDDPMDEGDESVQNMQDTTPMRHQEPVLSTSHNSGYDEALARFIRSEIDYNEFLRQAGGLELGEEALEMDQASKENDSFDVSIQPADYALLIDQVAEKDAKISELTEQLKKYSSAVALLKEDANKQQPERAFCKVNLAYAVFVVCYATFTTASMVWTCFAVAVSIAFVAFSCYFEGLVSMQETENTLSWIHTNFPDVLVNAPARSLQESASATRKVTLAVGSNGLFGILYFGNMITEVRAGTLAKAAGVRAGDQIISIDGVNVEFMPREEIIDLYEKARANRGTMQLRHNPERLRDLNYDAVAYWKESSEAVINVQTDESVARTFSNGSESTDNDDVTVENKTIPRTVQLSRGGNGLFGVSYRNTSISEVHKGGAAEKGGLEIGDKVLSINGVNVENLSTDEFGMVLKRVIGVAKLVVFNPDHRQTRNDSC